MKKYLFPLLLTSFLFAELSTVKTPTAVNVSFELNNTAANFDTSLSYTHQNLLTCSPKLSAVYKIMSDSKLKVIPKVPLHSSTEYSCSPEGTAFTFKTDVITIFHTHPIKNLSRSFN